MRKRNAQRGDWMELKWVAVFLVGLVLLAGCTGNAGTGANAGAAANGGANANAGANVNGNAGNNGANANAGADVNGNAGSNAAQAAGLVAMQALGVPTQCTVRVSGQPDETLFIKGQNMRVQSKTVENGQTVEVTSIIKGKTFYVDAKAFGNESQGCDWLMMESNDTQTAGAQQPPSGGVDEKTLENIPPTDFTCQPAVFGDEKFATPGKVCTFADLMANAIKNTGMTDEQKVQACASMTDPTYRQALGCP